MNGAFAFDRLLSEEMLFRWHRMMMSGSRNLRDVGRYRTGAESMHVVSAGAIHEPRIHFESPPSSRVPSKMKQFVCWFGRTAPGRDEPLPALTRAGIVHLYFESIHPFEDGKGRYRASDRGKSFGAEARPAGAYGPGGDDSCSPPELFQALEAANQGNEITRWLMWFAGVAIEGQRRTMALVEFLIDKTKSLDRLKGQLDARQDKALLRMFREGRKDSEAACSKDVQHHH